MDQRKLELYKRGMASRLYGSHLDDERSTYLSDYKNVLSDLPAANGENWDLAFATVVHISYADGFLDEIGTEFKEGALTHVERLEAETYGDTVVSCWRRIRHGLDSDWTN